VAESGIRRRVEGTLRLETDGVALDVVGDGSTLRCEVSDPAALRRSLGRSRGVTARIADTLDGLGLTVELTEQGRHIGALGAGVGSPLGRLLLGSRHVTLNPLGWGLLRAPAGLTARQTAAGAAGGLAVVAALAATRRARTVRQR
jgi:hypothetical protein